MDFFKHYFGEEFVLKLVEFTNAQHQIFIRNCDIRLHSRFASWREITIAEMYVFLAVTYYLPEINI